MSLNRDAGERIEGMSDKFRVAPLAKWRELTGIQVPYQIPGKFRPRTATRPMYEDALETAKNWPPAVALDYFSNIDADTITASHDRSRKRLEQHLAKPE